MIDHVMNEKLFSEEKLYFKYKCTHGKSEGDLYVTSHRFMWRSSVVALNQSSAPFEYTWNNINKAKYSPSNDPKGRSAVNLELAVPSPTGYTTFELTGNSASKEECRGQLEKLKFIVGNIKKGDLTLLDPIKDDSFFISNDHRPRNPLVHTGYFYE